MTYKAPPMQMIEVRVSTNKVGSDCSDTFFIDPDATDEEIEIEARSVMFNMLEWNWLRIEDPTDK